MKLTFFHILFFVTVASSVRAAESTNRTSEVIQFGIEHSTLIVAGKFGPTVMGGGGATSGVEIEEVIKAPQNFQTPKPLVVYWLSAKSDGVREFPMTNSYLFFLRPASTNADAGYQDVTDKAHPLIQASATNLFYVKSRVGKK